MGLVQQSKATSSDVLALPHTNCLRLFGNNEEQSAQCVEMKGPVAIWTNLRQVAAVVFLHLDILKIQVQ